MNENEELLIRYRHTQNEEEQARLYSELMSLLNERKQLENIEEDLGIDLITLFKALKNGAYFKNPYHSGEKIRYFNNLYSYLDLKNNRFDIRMSLFVGLHTYSTGGALFLFKDYGKTWALTKEELE